MALFKQNKTKSTIELSPAEAEAITEKLQLATVEMHMAADRLVGASNEAKRVFSDLKKMVDSARAARRSNW